MASKKKAPAAKKKPGPAKWEPPSLVEVESLAARGLTMQQIADAMGISLSTLGRRKTELEEFDQAIKRGQAKGVSAVTNALFEKALNGDTASAIFYLKNRAGWRDRSASEVSGPGGAPIQTETRRVSRDEWRSLEPGELSRRYLEAVRPPDAGQ